MENGQSGHVKNEELNKLWEKLVSKNPSADVIINTFSVLPLTVKAVELFASVDRSDDELVSALYEFNLCSELEGEDSRLYVKKKVVEFSKKLLSRNDETKLMALLNFQSEFIDESFDNIRELAWNKLSLESLDLGRFIQIFAGDFEEKRNIAWEVFKGRVQGQKEVVVYGERKNSVRLIIDLFCDRWSASIASGEHLGAFRDQVFIFADELIRGAGYTNAELSSMLNSNRCSCCGIVAPDPIKESIGRRLLENNPSLDELYKIYLTVPTLGLQTARRILPSISDKGKLEDRELYLLLYLLEHDDDLRPAAGNMLIAYWSERFEDCPTFTTENIDLLIKHIPSLEDKVRELQDKDSSSVWRLAERIRDSYFDIPK